MTCRNVLVAAAALAFAAPVHARNDTFMQPMADAMHRSRAHEMSDDKGEAAARDGRLFECHAGGVRSYVWLRAQVSRVVPSARPLPPATGFAAIDDADAVPLSEEGKARYRHFLTLPMPRAFVVMADGHWYMTWKSGEAMTTAFDDCARAGKRCWLYAVDDRVVWTPDLAHRIGSSAQLPGRRAGGGE